MEAVEIDPPAGARSDLGCIVVCPDGELYELQLLVSFSSDGVTVDRRENLRELDLPPEAYVLYARSALQKLAALCSG